MGAAPGNRAVDFVRQLDQAARDFVPRLHSPWQNPLFIDITYLGDRIFLAVVVVAAILALLLRRLRRTALIVVLAALAGMPLSDGVKLLVHRPRPDVPWRLIDLPTSPSFPSGHALESTIVYGGLALTAGRRLRRRGMRAAAFVLGGALPLLIGFSRVYLGVHYFTDVLAGWAAGLAVVLLAAWADRRWGGDQPSA